MSRKYQLFFAAATIALAGILHADPAMAAASGASGMPWETGLQTFTNSLKGPVAFAVSLAGVIGAGAGLIWGGELGHFAKTGINITLVVSVICLASNLIMNLTGVGAAF